MGSGFVFALVLFIYFLGFRFYSRFVEKNVYQVDSKAITPAHYKRDDIDYVPTKKLVLFGHHYASIAGLSPILGPSVAVIWGWLPALLWVTLGALFFGCVHDFGALVISVKNQGQSIGSLSEKFINARVKALFHGIIFFLVSLGMGVFVYVIAFLFSPALEESSKGYHFPEAIIPTFGLMILAIFLAVCSKKWPNKVSLLLLFGVLLTVGFIAVCANDKVREFFYQPQIINVLSIQNYSYFLLGYAFLASVMPVWLLLQPRDFLNSFVLYLALFFVSAGIIIFNPPFLAPMVRLSPPDAPSLFPFVFIIIACGSISGFHALVSSGTTAKQLNNEKDARIIGYGGMMGESLLGVIAILATTAGLQGQNWLDIYDSWENVQGLGLSVSNFILGTSYFVKGFGFSESFAQEFLSVVVISFALTSLDSATRLLRYNIEEIASSLGLKHNSLRYPASMLAVLAIGFFAFYKINGQPAGMALWSLFGTTNQLLAGLTFLVLSFYLLQKKSLMLPVVIPMAGVLLVSLFSMALNMLEFYQKGENLLFLVGLVLFLMALWLLSEGFVHYLHLTQKSPKAFIKKLLD